MKHRHMTNELHNNNNNNNNNNCESTYATYNLRNMYSNTTPKTMHTLDKWIQQYN
jgi:hypothetical protein